jgi:putative DNA methylase
LDYPKRLIEVDLPIKRISAHARREKDMRMSHIPSLHIYPAARPPAACRAVGCAALWPDPADSKCPQQFREAAQQLMSKWAADHLALTGPESMRRFNNVKADPDVLNDPIELRKALLDFIADFAAWDAACEPAFLETARALTAAAHESLGGSPHTRPLVVDPFAGGGAIPLEALRIGADVFATDLNPVAVIINKTILEFVPRYGNRLADEVEAWGRWAVDRATAELSDFYPADANGDIPIAYLWARTIRCEGPGCGAEVPLMKSFWLARKSRFVALNAKPNPSKKRLEFSVVDNPRPSDVPPSTVARGSATCPCCGFTTAAPSVRSQLKTHRGASSSARLYAVVTAASDGRGRGYRVATDKDLAAYARAAKHLEELGKAWAGPVSLIPEESMPVGGGRGAGRAFTQRNYGMTQWADVFNRRQLLALSTFAKLAREYVDGLKDEHFATAVSACLGLVVDRLADLNAALCGWQLNTPNTAHVFVRWALQITWDYGEVNPLAGAGGSPESAIGRMARTIRTLAGATMHGGQAQCGSADNHSLPDDSVSAFITDPPYYDAVPYSDLLDFFYVWLKRSLSPSLASLTRDELCPKNEECIVDEVKAKDKAYYERTMAKAMAEARRVLVPEGVGVVVFAHKTTSGWEAQLQSMIDAGLMITASWPIDTEMGSRMRAQGSAALASSVHLVCRPRENADGSVRKDDVGDWRSVLSDLPRRIHEWMPRLAEEGVVGADAIFACLGPALEIFSRYSRVEKASGEVVTLREYLEQVWAAVSTEALSMIFRDADAAGLESDARFTAIVLWTLGAGGSSSSESTAGESEDAEEEDDEDESPKGKAAKGGYTLEFDAARKIAQGLGVNLEQIDSVVEVKGNKARLRPVSERTAALFGKAEKAEAAAKKRGRKATQKKLFDKNAEEGGGSADTVKIDDGAAATPGGTALDRVHQAMLLFASGRAEALKRFVVEDGVGGDARFWKLAQSLSALYPAGSDEKRWVDGVLARKKSFGF